MTKKIAGWIAGLAATVGALILLWTNMDTIKSGIAQEAAKAGADTAVVVVEQYMAPVQAELEDIRFAQDREFIEEKWGQCMTYGFPELAVEVRRICCDAERDWRWAVWEWEQCQGDECAPEPEQEECP
jgi:hypothetical protein